MVNSCHLRFCSYNCCGFNDSKKPYVASLLTKCDFLFLQEHWLSEAQLTCLNSISDDHLATGICGFDNSEVLFGRPFGGCAIVWRKNLDAHMTVVDTGSRRLCALRLCSNSAKFLLVNVYMPYEDVSHNATRTEEFISLLSAIEYLNSQCQDCTVIVGGDFNVDLCRNSNHTTLLNKFCSDNNLYPVVRHSESCVDYTYQFNMSRFSVLDHFIIPGALFDTAVGSVHAEHNVDNRSDHEPLFLRLNISSYYTSCTNKVFTRKVAWHKANSEHISNYRCVLQRHLQSIVLPTDALMCRNVLCCNNEHRCVINNYTNDIINACLSAAEVSIPMTSNRNSSGVIPGWKDEVEPLREKSMFWHSLWIDCGRPHSGAVADIMRRSRASYHYAIRSARKREQDIVNERFATALLSHKDRDFWSEVKRIRSHKNCPSNVVDNLSTPESIADFFAKKYEDLYTSVSYSVNDMQKISDEVDALIGLVGFDDSCTFKYADVVTAINRLHSGKGDGDKGLMSEHLKQGCDELFIHIALLFTSMAVHGYVPDEFRISTIIPIPKGKNANLTDSNNYRGITLGSIFGKVFDLIVLDKYSDLLVTSDLQFGFKARRSTNMCSMVLKETISYYVNSQSTVYCTLLDATKAFDRVEYSTLFRTLISRHLPPMLIRVLLFMYTHNTARVTWNGFISHQFSILNGVKQGGVLSPILFCIYFDGLLHKLSNAGYGCYIGYMFVGALAYADDVVLLAPSANAMRRMLLLCEEYADEYSVKFNASKSKCLVIQPRLSRRSTDNLSFCIDGNNIETVTQWPHLGHIITNKCDDDDADIMNRRNCLVAQINTVLCYFGKLPALTKLKLMKAYCSSLYGCELWDLSNGCINNVCVTWRKGLRRVWSLPYNTHTHLLPALCNDLPLFDFLCKRVMSFLHACVNSNCSIVSYVSKFALLHGRMFSPLGRNALYCRLRFGLDITNFLSVKFSPDKIIWNHYLGNVSPKLQADVDVLKDMLMFRENKQQCVFTRDEIETVIQVICTE